MKIFIALAATAPLKGDRVVVKFGTNQWYTGTVASVGKKITVLFDDGEKHAYELGDPSVKVIISKRKSKSVLTNADAKLLYSTPKPTASPRTPKAAAAAPTKIAPTTQEPAKPIALTDSDVAHQRWTRSKEEFAGHPEFKAVKADIVKGEGKLSSVKIGSLTYATMKSMYLSPNPLQRAGWKQVYFKPYDSSNVAVYQKKGVKIKTALSSGYWILYLALS